MSIAKRMYALIFIVALGLSLLFVLTLLQINRVYDKANYATVNSIPSLIVLDKVSVAFGRVRSYTWQYVISTDSAEKSKILAGITEQRNTITAQLNLYEKQDVSNDKDRALLAVDKASLNDYLAVMDKAIALAVSAEGNPEAAQLMRTKHDVIPVALKALQEHSDFNADIAHQSEVEAKWILSNAIWEVSVMVLVILIYTG